MYNITQKRQEQREQIEINIRKNALLYKQVFKEGPALDVWNDLQNVFDSRPSYVLGGSTHDTAYFEGQKDVIRYIKERINYAD